MNIDILSENQLETLSRLINQSSSIVICCHKSPDGDALGSSLALAQYLQALGKTPAVAIPDACPDFLQWLPSFSQSVVRYDKHPDTVNSAFQKADLVFCLDFNTPARLSDMQAAFDASSAPRIMIDHHLSPDMPGTELAISLPDMSSTCELLFRVIWQMGGFSQLTPGAAACLYCGMMTDTGGFTYNSSRPEIFLIISYLLSKGIDKDEIYNRVFHNFSSWCIRMRGYVMYQKLNVLDDVHAAWFALTREEMTRFHFIKGDAEGLVNVPLTIKGLKMSISLREDTQKDNTIWVSLRSSNGFHCREVAEQFFNGGGHADAAGGKLMCSMEEAEAITRRAIAAFADRLKG